MAFGFPPRYHQEIALDNFTPEHFLVVAIESAKKLGWDISYTGENEFVAYTGFSMSSWSEEVHVKVENITATLQSECVGRQLNDWGRNKKNIENLVAKIEEEKEMLTPEDIELKLEELKTAIAPGAEERYPSKTKNKVTGFLSLFQPRDRYFVTPILIDVNIAIFLLMCLSGVNAMQPTTESLLAWGANFKPLTLSGEWWRLITNIFLHIGVFHLLMNMYALAYIGLLLEPYLGKARFISAYLLTGITASMTSLYWHNVTISAGASGAIFGMYGVFLAMLTVNFIEKTVRRNLLTSILIFVGYNLLNGLKGGIDNAAHIGGLVGGIIIGYSFIPSLKKPDDDQLNFGTIGLLTALILTGSSIVYSSMPNDIGQYEAKMKEFATMEKKALNYYKLPQDRSKEFKLYEIKDRGISYWNECINLIDQADRLNVPKELHTKDTKLKEYCELRIKSYELLYKAVDENTNQYQSEINDYNLQIKAIIDDLSVKHEEK